MDKNWTKALVEQLDWHWTNQLRPRLEGLTDEEYYWEPVEDTWSIRPRGQGRAAMSIGGGDLVMDYAYPEPTPPPVTTIAWRLWHVASDCLADYLSRSSVSRPVGTTGTHWYGDVEPALRDLRSAIDAFRSHMTGLGEEGIREPMGPDWGMYGDQTWAELVVHATDEVAHHGAEIALLRDLYLWRER